ncbi:MAG: sigma-54-dependent Fis family transcriptional regulator [Opitutaceae bacterium]|nr:sigma-54-dependent Fis family transcriptional regulator [Opitutaceae bacterium]
MIPSVLIVDDEKHTREGLLLAFEENYDVSVASSAEEAFNLLEAHEFDVIVTDLRMPGKSGLKVIDKALTLPNRPVVIMMTAYGNIDSAVEAMKRGAFDFLTKPVNLEKLEILIQRALKSRTLEVEVKQLHERLDRKFSFEGIVGHSTRLTEVIERVKLVAPSRATVLIDGETGTGKELIAQAIHQASPRARAPFLAVHCAALPATLLESELFGHEKGAFTGATERRVGRFEAADGGTLFLDEIGEVSPSTQVKLLRFLETRAVERIGSQKPVQLDVRLVAASNRVLEQMVAQGTFREDLFFRLNVVRITTPPLRDRTDDIPLLLEHFIAEFSKENNVPPLSIEPGALKHLTTYPWPGNIRELRNFAENVVVLRRGGRLTEFDLEPKFRGTVPLAPPPRPAIVDVNAGGAVVPAVAPTAPGGATMAAGPSLSVEENERRLLRQALMESRGNRTQAAKLMGISRRTLHRKLAQWPELDVTDRG